MLYNTLRYKGKNWRYVYLDPNPKVGRGVTETFLRQCIEMHSGEENERRISGADYDIKILAGKSQSLGFFSGVSFMGRVESDKGTASLAVLLLDGINKNVLN